MIDQLAEVYAAELAGFLSEEECREYSQHLLELADYMATAPDEELDEDWFGDCLEFAKRFGYQMAERQLPMESLLHMSGQFRKHIIGHLYQVHYDQLQQPTVFDRTIHISNQVTQYTNHLVLGYNQHQNEAIARAYELQRNQILDNLPVGVVVYDAQGRCVFANRRIYARNKLTPDQVIGKLRTELAGNYNETPEADGLWERVLAGEKVMLRLETVGEDGMSLNEKEMIPLKDENNRVSGVIAVSYPPLSERERLYHLQKQFSFVLNSMNSGLLVLNQEHVVTGFNKKAEEIFGIPAEDVLGMPLKQLYREHTEGSGKKYSLLATAMEQGILIADVECTIKMKRRKITLRMDGNPILNACGSPVGYILVIDDLTEILAMREAMIRNEKFALIGQFAAGIAHEIRNPLTTVFGFLQLYSRNSVKEESFKDLVGKLLIPELDRANTILSDFLMVSRPQAPQRTHVDTGRFMEDVVRLVESEAHLRGVMIEVQMPENLPSLNLDIQQMKQVFLNLCKNGLDVMASGGKMILRLRVEGDMVRFDVIDQGAGISAQDLSHIFEPFYTTKENGTGLGLPISHRIVEGHGGTLNVSSVEGVGTTFTISIPTHE